MAVLPRSLCELELYVSFKQREKRKLKYKKMESSSIQTVCRGEKCRPRSVPGSVRCICRTMKNIREEILNTEEVDADEDDSSYTSESSSDSSYSKSEDSPSELE